MIRLESWTNEQGNVRTRVTAPAPPSEEAGVVSEGFAQPQVLCDAVCCASPTAPSRKAPCLLRTYRTANHYT